MDHRQGDGISLRHTRSPAFPTALAHKARHTRRGARKPAGGCLRRALSMMGSPRTSIREKGHWHTDDTGVHRETCPTNRPNPHANFRVEIRVIEMSASSSMLHPRHWHPARQRTRRSKQNLPKMEHRTRRHQRQPSSQQRCPWCSEPPSIALIDG